MLLIPIGEPVCEYVDLSDLEDVELRGMYFDAIDDYEGCIEDADEEDAEYQQCCADSIRELSNEAKRRGLFLRTLH